MVKVRSIGIILVLTGLFLLITSSAFISGYNKKLGLLGSTSKMEIVLNEGIWLSYPPGYTPPDAPLPAPVSPDDPFYQRYLDLKRTYIDPLENFTPHYEGRISISFKYFFAIDMFIIFLGITIMIMFKLKTREQT